MFALLSGLAGTAASVIIRLELSAPGNGLLGGNHQLYNSIVTSHALLMSTPVYFESWAIRSVLSTNLCVIGLY